MGTMREAPLHSRGPAEAVEVRTAGYAPLRDYAAVEAESLLVPRLVPATAATPAATPAPVRASRDDFWQQLGEALGMPLETFDEPARQAVALQAARLLRQCVGQLQQSLRTRSELKGELRLQQTTVQSAGNNPLKHAVNSEEAMQALLRAPKSGQLKGEQAVANHKHFVVGKLKDAARLARVQDFDLAALGIVE